MLERCDAEFERGHAITWHERTSEMECKECYFDDNDDDDDGKKKKKKKKKTTKGGKGRFIGRGSEG